MTELSNEEQPSLRGSGGGGGATHWLLYFFFFFCLRTACILANQNKTQWVFFMTEGVTNTSAVCRLQHFGIFFFFLQILSISNCVHAVYSGRYISLRFLQTRLFFTFNVVTDALTLSGGSHGSVTSLIPFLLIPTHFTGREREKKNNIYIKSEIRAGYNLTAW